MKHKVDNKSRFSRHRDTLSMKGFNVACDYRICAVYWDEHADIHEDEVDERRLIDQGIIVDEEEAFRDD